MAADLTDVTITLVRKIINAEINAKAIGALLLEKGIITEDEIAEKYDYIFERDFDKSTKELIEAIIEEGKRNQESSEYNESFGGK